MLEILFRNQDFAAVNKPAGIAVHQEEGADNLLAMAAARLNVPRLWLTHRLDKPTSGVLLLALNAQAASELAQQFAAKTMRKTYLALSDRRPAKKQGLVKGGMEKSRMEADARRRRQSGGNAVSQPKYRPESAAVRIAAANQQNPPAAGCHEKPGQPDSRRYPLRRHAGGKVVPPCVAVGI